jgi:bacteriocin-like protein
MSEPKNPEASPSADAHAADHELTEEDLAQISGGVKPTLGTTAVVQSKAKTADKAYKQMDAYLKQ